MTEEGRAMPATTGLRCIAAPALLLATLALAPAVPRAEEAAGEPLSPRQREEVFDLLRRALRDDPTILRDAMLSLRAAAERSRAEAARGALAAHADDLLRDPADPVKGNPQGSVTVVEFFDARCGYCRQMEPAMAELLKRDGDVRLVLKDLPVLGPNSVLASRALFAAQRQGKYAELHDALLAMRGDTPEPVLQAEAERVGLDWARLRRDMDDPTVQQRIDRNLRLAQSLGIQGTPALVVGEALVPGAVDLAALQGLVAEARGRPR
jgi:protein-disulfide isomerase